MTEVAPAALSNAIMGKLYNVLTNGDDTVPKSTDNFFSWLTPGMPFREDDFDFLTQGLTGIVKRSDVEQLVVPGTPAGAAPTDGAAGSSGAGGQPGAGQVLTPELINTLRAQDAGRMMMQAEQLSRLCDFIPDVTTINNKQCSQFSVANNEGSLSDRYELILRMSQVMQSELPDDVKQKIAKFRGLLQTTTKKKDLITDQGKEVTTGPSPLVLAYNDRMTNYLNKALEYNQYRIDALGGNDPKAVQFWALNANLLRAKVRAAMDDWINNGYKDDYEAIAAYIDQVQARDMAMLKAEYKDDFEKARLTGLSSGSDFYYTALVPGDFLQSDGWSDFSFKSSDFHSHSNSQFDASGWSASGSSGFFGIGAHGNASGNSQTNSYNGTFNLDTFKMSFQICQTMIVRPWFKTAFLMSKAWRFDETNPDVKGDKGMVCDGGKPPKGLIQAYPTAAYWVRELCLEFGENSEFSNWYSQQKSSSQSGSLLVGLGQFALGGSANHWSKNGYTNQDSGGENKDGAIRVKGPQLIGFKCHIPAECPDPDPGIKSWV
jgi:hypothetical protein